MTVVARKLIARPARTSGDTWKKIAELVCGSDVTAAAEFARVSGIASSLISEDLFRSSPMTVIGSAGPRLRVYCLYDDDAVTAEDQNESALTWNPTDGEWIAYLPCASEDVGWTAKALKDKSRNFVAYDVAKGIDEVDDRDGEARSQSGSAGVSVDVEGFMKL